MYWAELSSLIERADYRSIVRNTNDELAGDWAANPVNAHLFIKSDFTLPIELYVPDTESTISKRYTAHIDAITADKLEVHMVRTEVTDKNGTRTISSTPGVAGDSSFTMPDLIFPITVIIAALGGFGLGIAYRKGRKWKK